MSIRVDLRFSLKLVGTPGMKASSLRSLYRNLLMQVQYALCQPTNHLKDWSVNSSAIGGHGQFNQDCRSHGRGRLLLQWK